MKNMNIDELELLIEVTCDILSLERNERETCEHPSERYKSDLIIAKWQRIQVKLEKMAQLQYKKVG